MELKRILRVLIILLIGSGLAMTTIACGESELENQNEVNGDDEGDDENGGDDEGDDENGGDDEGDDENGGDDEGDDEKDYVELADPPPSCADADAPERCSEDPADFDDWSPASLITELAIADRDCCFDFSGNGQPDNSLPDIIGIVPDTELADVNETLAESIADGTITLVLEHSGLTDLEAGAEFDIHFLLGEHAEGGVKIDPVSFEDGVYPEAVLPDAKITEEGDLLIVTAGPGTVFLAIELFDLELELAIRNAKVEAIAVGTGEDGGVILEEGILGGLILFEDLAAAINNITSTCDCLGNPTEIISVEPGDASTAQCVLEASDEEIASCDAEEELCGQIAGICDVIPFATIFADIATTSSGANDAFSAGLTFEAGSTLILGLTDDE